MKPRPLLHRLLPALTGGLFIALWYVAHFLLSSERRFLLPPPHDVLLAKGSGARRREGSAPLPFAAAA